MSHLNVLPRDQLVEALNGNLRLAAAFEDQALAVDDVVEAVGTTAAATEALNEATVLVLSPNTAFTNERIVQAGTGIDIVDDGSHVTIKVDADVPIVSGGAVKFFSTAATNLLLPKSGTLATLAGAETLANKTIQKPKISTYGDFADDTAAATGGVPVGGIYRTGSVLKVRVT